MGKKRGGRGRLEGVLCFLRKGKKRRKEPKDRMSREEDQRAIALVLRRRKENKYRWKDNTRKKYREKRNLKEEMERKNL